MSKVNEILDHLISDVAPDEDGCSQYEGLDEQDEAESTAKLSAKQQLLAEVLDIIGEKKSVKELFPDVNIKRHTSELLDCIIIKDHYNANVDRLIKAAKERFK